MKELERTDEARKEGLPKDGVHKTLTEAEARKYISKLTFAEKIRLNEMLKALEQKRLLSPARLESVGKGGK